MVMMMIPIPATIDDNELCCPHVGPGRVCAQPATDPIKSGGRNLNPSPTNRMIGSSGSKLQQDSGGSVGVKNLENIENQA